MSTEQQQQKGAMYTGVVKWYSKKLGYGYIEALTLNGLPCDSMDSFVHYTAITVDDSCSSGEDVFRYLVQGEVVEYTVVPVVGHEKHTHQADKVTGICGRSLTYQQRLIRGDVLRQRREESKGRESRKGYGRGSRDEHEVVSGYKYARDDEFVEVKRGRHAKEQHEGGTTVIIVKRRDHDDERYMERGRGQGRGQGRGRGGRGGAGRGRGRGVDSRIVL